MKKKVYLIEWKSSSYTHYSDVVKAKDVSHAWTKVRMRHPFTTDRFYRSTILEGGRHDK